MIQAKSSKKTAKKTKKTPASARVAAQAKAAKGARKQAAKKKTAPTKRVVTANSRAVYRNQEVETMQLKPKARVARAGAGGGDFQGVSLVEDADSESADELLEDGQAFEAGVVSGVEEAACADQGEVKTHQVPQDDVPGEYDEEKDKR
jgi:hypothetical protein